MDGQSIGSKVAAAVARAGLSTYAVYRRRSHEMKQTDTRVVSGGRRGSIVLAGERKGSSSHSGEWRDSGVLWRHGASSLLHLGRAACRDRGKTPKPLLSCLSRPSLDTVRVARALKIT